MPKGTQSASDLARNIRIKKLEAMKERDRFAQEDELDKLRDENQKLKTYSKTLEGLLATVEGALLRMSNRDVVSAPVTPPTYPPAKTGAKKTRAKMPPKPNGGSLFDPMAADEQT